MAELRGQKEAAKALGGPQTHSAGECVAVAANIFTHQHHGAFHALDVLEQAVTGRGQNMAAGRALKQLGPQFFFQAVQTPGDGGVIDPQAPCGLLC